jgi:hypothetical protein
MMRTAAAFADLEPFDLDLESTLPVSLQLERFLDGDTNGHSLLSALYGRAAAEPVPDRLLAILRRN